MGHREHLHFRLEILWALLYGIVGLLALRLVEIQLLKNVFYTRAAERNRTQIIRQTAPRGRIVDRKGEVIAGNQAVFSVIYKPGKNRDAAHLSRLSRDLAPLINEEPEEVLRVLNQAIKEETAIRLAEKLPSKPMFKLKELRLLYPEIEPIDEERRFYPKGAFATHLLGHMGKIDDVAWKRLKKEGYRVDSWIGKAGLEKLFENELRGADGGIRMEVDVRGRIKNFLDPVPSKPGSTLVLTIDAKLQTVAEEALRATKSKSGAAVVLDPRNGNVLVLASVPDYDPNVFLEPDANADKLKSLPEFNLALQGSYPPGSIFKIISGAAMLNEGGVNPEEQVYCPGYFDLGNRTFACWEKKGHKNQNFLQGLTHSCDVYFYKMGLRAGGALIERYEEMFGLGRKTLLGLPGESIGHIFGPKARKARKAGWFEGDTVNLAIGQGELLVTPVQMATMIATVANKGTIWRPAFYDRIEYADGRPPYRHEPEQLGRVDLKEGTWRMLHEALENVVNDGTGKGARMSSLVIGGKTGTAQNPGKDDHAWFVAYAGRPGEEPSLALAVLVQFGGHGAEAAVPVARKLIEQAFLSTQAPAPIINIPMKEPGPPVVVH